jgi:hypothetical protein
MGIAKNDTFSQETARIARNDTMSQEMAGNVRNDTFSQETAVLEFKINLWRL